MPLAVIRILDAAVPPVISTVCIAIEAGGVRSEPTCTNVEPSAACITCTALTSVPYLPRSNVSVAAPPLPDRSTVGVVM